MSLPRIVRRLFGLGVAAGAGVTAYAAWEARAFTLRLPNCSVSCPSEIS